jgi:hypothetical protein
MLGRGCGGFGSGGGDGFGVLPLASSAGRGGPVKELVAQVVQ